MNENQIGVEKYTGMVIRGVRYPVIPTVYDDALSYYEAIEKLAEAVNEALQYLYGLADTVVEQTNTYTDQQVALLKAELQKQIVDGDDKLQDLYNQIVISQGELTVKVNQLYQAWSEYQTQIDGRFQAQAVALKQYVDSLVLDRVIYVINPVTGHMSTIQVALNDMWKKFNVGGLTASEYDRMYMTATEYDSQGLTAMEYDTRARWHLAFFRRLYLLMRDPFSGLMQTYEHVINELAGLHKDALTATEYDALELTADEYDEKGLTAYQYDWDGAKLLTV